VEESVAVSAMGQAEATHIGLPTEINRMGLGPVTGKATNWERPLRLKASLPAGTMETVPVEVGHAEADHAEASHAKVGHAKVGHAKEADHAEVGHAKEATLAEVALAKAATRATRGTRELRMTTTGIP